MPSSHKYSVSQKKTPYLCQLRTKFATKRSLHIPPHLKRIAALPSETVMFKLLASSGANIQTSLKCGELCNDHFVANYVLSPAVKEF